MDGERFDTLTRTLSSRRTALVGLASGLTALLGSGASDTGAHNPASACRKLKDASKRRACLRRARKHNRTHQCKARPVAATCAGRCGTWRNNCGKPVTCPTCPPGRVCTENGSCARPCIDANDCAPFGCGCFVDEPVGQRYCGAAGTMCPGLVLCASTASCPVGTRCQTTNCPDGPNPTSFRCVPLCPS